MTERQPQRDKEDNKIHEKVAIIGIETFFFPASLPSKPETDKNTEEKENEREKHVKNRFKKQTNKREMYEKGNTNYNSKKQNK